jgi:hypothetical protein
MGDQRNELKNLVLLLYYPAVLGAGVVFAFSKWTEAGSFWEVVTGGVQNYLAMWIILFFSVSYLMTDALSGEKYKWPAFLLDLVEIGGGVVPLAVELG